MKKILILLVLVATSLLAQAQTRQLKVYLHSGAVDTLRMTAGSTIAHSRFNLQGERQDDYVTMVVTIDDNVRKYAIADLDSLVLPNGQRIIFRGSQVVQPVMAKAMGDVTPDDVGDLTGREVRQNVRKTSFGGVFPGSDVVTFYWIENDRIRLDVGDEARAEDLSDDKTEATFIFDGAELDGNSYVVYYPNKTVTIATEQTQNGANNSDHVGDAGDCGTALAQLQSDGTYSFTLQHKASYLCFLPHIDNLPSAKITKIVLSSSSAIAGDYQMSMSGLYSGQNTSTTITLNLNPQREKDFIIGHDLNTVQDTCAAYMVIAPQDGSRNFTATYFITDTLSRITTTYQQSFSFQPVANTVYPINCRIPDDVFAVVDMGLSTKWSHANLAAKEPSQSGTDYSFADGDPALTSTVVTQWATPTNLQMQELIDGCTWERSLYNGENGWLVTANNPGYDGICHRLFLPDGNYWTSGYTSADSTSCYSMTLGASQPSLSTSAITSQLAIRPVEVLMVDMGLPGHTLWATHNIGATAPSMRGEYYAWGETETKNVYSLNTYDPLGNGTGAYDNLDTNIAGTQYDVARKKWGGAWRIPTKSDFDELNNSAYCQWTWTAIDGQNGYLVKSLSTGNSIFLPAAGYRNGVTRNDAGNYGFYYSSVPYSATHQYAWGLQFYSNSWHYVTYSQRQSAYRYLGFSIRPVVTYNGTDLMVTSDSVQWKMNDTEAILHGTFASTSPLTESVKVGFLVGDSLNLTMANADSVFTFTRSANGTFSATMPVYKNVGHCWRAYVQNADTLILGDVLEYGERMVDLGLPSGVLWRNMNVGASRVEERGDYYQWGEVVTKDNYTYANYDPLGNGGSQYDDIGTDISGSDDYDAARHNLGGYWRMPTKAELEELNNNCDWQWKTINGQTGYKLTSRINGNSIFLPAAGYRNNTSLNDANSYGFYYSSEPYSATHQYAWGLQFYDNSWHYVTYSQRQSAYRYLGFTLRPVTIPGTLLSTGARIDIETDTLDYVPGTDHAQLYGTLTKYNHWSDNMTVGFIIGDNANFTAAEAVDTVTTVVRNSGQYTLEVPYSGGDRWFRAVLFDGEDSYVGRAIHYATVVTTDSASYRQGTVANTVTLYGNLTSDPTTLTQPVTVGFYIGKDKYVDRATAIDSVKTTVDANGKFSLTIAQPDTIVYYRAFVELNDTCRGYGISRHFGFAFVDLGLPSGTWWANTNLGAASEVTNGDQYAWGELQPKTQFTTDNYTHYDATNGYADLGHDIAYSQYDAATHELGALTSMPSITQYAELFKYTTQVKDTVDGTPVIRFVGSNGNSIIMYRTDTATATAWSSTENALQYAYFGTPGSTALTPKTSGMSIRPVRRINAFDANGVKLGVTADSARWTPESTVATLYGSIHAAEAFSPVKVGFVVGDSAAVTKATADTIMSKQVSAAGQYSMTYNYKSRPAYYRAFVELSDTTYYGTARRVGIAYVDLGLASHTLWADMNLGAEEPSGLGYYVAWGDTISTRRQFGSNANCDTYDAANNNWKDIGLNISNTKYDAARILGKGLWSMPTNTQWQELFDCTWTNDTIDNVVGYRITGPNGKSIFLRANGHNYVPTSYPSSTYNVTYWTANTIRTALADPNSQYADLYNRSLSTSPRYFGMPIRPVATYTNITRDSTYLYLTADSCDWTASATEIHLYGTLRSQTPLTGTTYGFVIGRNNNPEIGAEGVTQLATTNTNGLLTATSTLVGDRYYYRPFITVGDTTYYGKECRYGYAMIDLGLPSHTLWADVNLGATTDDGYGDYYQFGETEPQLTTPFDDSTYSLHQCITDSLGTIAHSQYDAASVNLGGVWSIPTRAEILELARYCTTTADTLNGTWGVRLTGPNGNSIFIPRAYYASGSSFPTYNSGAPAYIMSANAYMGSLSSSNYVWQNAYYSSIYAPQWNFSNGWYTDYTYNAYYGYPIRAVAHVSDTLATTSRPVGAVLRKWMPKKASEGRDLLEGRIYGVPADKTISAMGFILGRDSLLTTANGTVYASTLEDVAVNDSISAAGCRYRSTVPHISSQMWSRPYFVVDGQTYYGLPHTVGPRLVDLGLPSGTMWADINVGSIEPGGEGEYYQWGEIVPEDETSRYYYDNTYQYNNIFIGADIARTEYDAASQKWSPMYAMPTDLQWRELMANTILRPDTVNGSYGMRFIGSNGNSIFMPYQGYRYQMNLYSYGYNSSYGQYWSSCQSDYNGYYSASYTGSSIIAYFYGYNTLNGSHNDGYTYSKYYGMPIRPVGKISATLADGTPIYLEPIKAELSQSGYQLTGALSLPSGTTATTVGFYVGDDASVNAETGTLIAAALANDTITSTGYTVFTGTRRWFRPYAVINGETVLGSAKEYGVELVDMGFPSGTKWANMNLGAYQETDNGVYYSWGEIEPDDTKLNTAYGADAYDPLGDGVGQVDDLGADISGTQYDAVRAAWGSMWSMPTQDQFNELIANSIFQEVRNSNNSTIGYRVVSKLNGNSFYLPGAGYYYNYSGSSPYLSSSGYVYYWTSLVSSQPNANAFYISSTTSQYANNTYNRWYGMPLRPVARQNTALADGTLIYVGGTGSHLHDGEYGFSGLVLNVPTGVTVSSAGFVVGTDSLVTTATGTTVSATLVNDTLTSTQTVPDTGAKRWYRPFIVVDGQTIYGTANKFGVVLVDLGLPSGTLWADANLGADLPTEKGDFYLWGETTAPKTSPQTTAFLPPNYALYDSSTGSFIDVGMDISYTEYDAAHVKMGGLIGMPNVTQMKELVANCSFVPGKLDGVQGVWAVSRINDNRIFLPANGYWYFNNGSPYYYWDTYSPDLYYWTSSIQENTGGTNVYAHAFYSEVPNGTASTTNAYGNNTYYRYYGLGIRPVAQFNTTATDGRKFYFKSDSVAMHPAVPEAKLYATARGITSSMNDVNRGFVIGTSATVETGDAISTHAATALARGQFGATLDATYLDGLTVGTIYYARPFLTVGTQTFYGDAMTVTNSLTAYTDSTDWKQGATTVTFYGTADGATASSSPTYGFLLGDNADITATSTGVRDLSAAYINDSVFTAQVNDLSAGVYYYRAYAKVGSGYAYGIARRFGNGLVDLGLPSGTLWTTVNLGSQNDFKVDSLYAWGEKAAKADYTLATYDPAGDGTGTYDNIGTDISHTTYDVARAKLGNSYSIPTKALWEELKNNCTIVRDTVEGVICWKVTSKVEGYTDRFIYLPMTPNVWSSTTNGDATSQTAYVFSYNNVSNSNRYLGLAVRPVYQQNVTTAGGDDLFLHADSASYDTSAITATLHGTVRGITTEMTDVQIGFVIGTTDQVEMSTAMTDGTFVSGATADGTFSSTLSSTLVDQFAVGVTYYARPYITIGGTETLYGNALPIRNTLTVTTDSTNWQYGAAATRLCGAVRGISASSSPTYGFVVGKNATITAADQGVTIVNATLDGEVFKGTLTTTPDGLNYYRAFAVENGQYVYADARRFGLELVDLGLRSGTLWSNIDLGAQVETQTGSLYAWGEIATKASYAYDTYDPKGDGMSFYDNIGNDIQFSQYDVVTQNMGGLFAMPTEAQWTELANSCTMTSEIVDGVSGYRFTNKNDATKSIFIASGAYRWSSVKPSTTNSASYSYYAGQTSISTTTVYNGCPIRPVYCGNVTLADETVLNVSADSCNWQYGASKVKLYGAVRGSVEGQTLSYGFVVGDNANITVATSGVRNVSATLSGIKLSAQVDNTFGKSYYRAYVKQGDTYFYSTAKNYGLEMVDLGLPSGTLWAALNLGATTEGEYGDRYAWGEISAKTDFSLNTYDPKGDGTGSYDNIGKDIQHTRNDAATAKYGDVFAMPTREQIKELYENCSMTSTTINGVSGYLYTGIKPGYQDKSIFIPGSYIWTSEVYNNTATNTYAYCYYPGNTSNTNTGYRYNGYYIRPVYSGNVKLTDETVLNVSADSCDWSVNATKVNILGTVRGAVEGQSLTYGFVIGTDADVTAETTGVRNVPVTLNGNKLSAQVDNSQLGVRNYYRAYVKQGSTYHYSSAKSYGVGLVDLGLPSGTLWADVNLGASAESEYGDQYAWGETSPKSSFALNTYDPKGDGTGSYDNIGTDIQHTRYDAVKDTYGSLFAMPTREQFAELYGNCTMTSVTIDGISGYRYTSNREGYTDKSIFIPNTTVWSSQAYNSATDGRAYYYNPGNSYNSNYTYRYYGYRVRPVYSGNTELSGGGRVNLSTISSKRNTDKSFTLTGSLVGQTSGMTVSQVGFVLSGAQTVGVSTAADTTVVATLGTDGEFTAPLRAGFTDGYTDGKVYMRAYAIINGDTYYAPTAIEVLPTITVTSINVPGSGSSTYNYSDYAEVTINHLYDHNGTGNYTNSRAGYVRLEAAEGCKWTISGTVDTENNYDWVSIYNGTSVTPSGTYNSGMAVRWMGRNQTVTYTSTSNVIFVCFRSDGSTVYTGFDLQLKAQ